LKTNIERARGIRLILMDVDGTLTDGSLLVLPDGDEVKAYHVRDGMGILMAHLAGFKTGVITGKTSRSLEARARTLRITELHQGRMDKLATLEDILERHGLTPGETAYIGDDLNDLPVLRRVGLAGAPADAHPMVLQASHYRCACAGGRGAVREFLEFLFDAQEKWPVIEAGLEAVGDSS
jgi:3-deoxy-D-manno-octulosonate 8-phosphate phosphatase (KDO 8-P phosphatase)